MTMRRLLTIALLPLCGGLAAGMLPGCYGAGPTPGNMKMHGGQSGSSAGSGGSGEAGGAAAGSGGTAGGDDGGAGSGGLAGASGNAGTGGTAGAGTGGADTGGAAGAGTGGAGNGGAGNGGAGSGGAGSGGAGSGGAGVDSGAIGGGTGGVDAGTGGGGAGGSGTPSSARALAMKLGRPGNFLIGLGNDAGKNGAPDDIFTLGTTLDLHYAYLSGLTGEPNGGWQDWNPNGTFVNFFADAAAQHGVVPMFTVYQFAARGEDRTDVLAAADFMTKWWAALRLMFDRLAVFGKPALVHLEPDFWAYMQRASGGDPTKVKVLVKMVTDCQDLTDDLAGLGKCIVRLGRKYAPQALIGFHASKWVGTPAEIVSFMKAIAAGSADFLVTDPLDRDAGCYEAHVDPACMGMTGAFYWDESNATSPNFHENLIFVKTISDGVGKPTFWWQVPLGVPSSTPGGTAGHYRDNRAHYLFGHLNEFAAAGMAGVAFGPGAANQTTVTTDGGQFKTAVSGYYAHPFALP